ncbi:glycosyltransferase, partial [Candidatus Gottesmanbacteria bacterium]|nr:glycosyltransferase [Candidatus Gottesmanbacteria bacterium]
MRIQFSNKNCFAPEVSVVLLDWSCRESYHILHYVNNQKIPREQYEIIWIEYYSKQSPEINAGLEVCEELGKPPIIDKWIVIGMPRNVYFHKHLMYNIGILVARGKIVTFCDSDAIVGPNFVESIIKSFDEPNIVLHMDEARNNDKRFYPFNYPSIEEVIGQGCIN